MWTSQYGLDIRFEVWEGEHRRTVSREEFQQAPPNKQVTLWRQEREAPLPHRPPFVVVMEKEILALYFTPQYFHHLIIRPHPNKGETELLLKEDKCSPYNTALLSYLLREVGVEVWNAE